MDRIPFWIVPFFLLGVGIAIWPSPEDQRIHIHARYSEATSTVTFSKTPSQLGDKFIEVMIHESIHMMKPPLLWDVPMASIAGYCYARPFQGSSWSSKAGRTFNLEWLWMRAKREIQDSAELARKTVDEIEKTLRIHASTRETFESYRVGARLAAQIRIITDQTSGPCLRMATALAFGAPARLAFRASADKPLVAFLITLQSLERPKYTLELARLINDLNSTEAADLRSTIQMQFYTNPSEREWRTAMLDYALEIKALEAKP